MDIMSFLLGYESGKSAGKKWIHSTGTFKPTSGGHTIQHNLGVSPDMMMMWARKTPSAQGLAVFVTGFSDAVMENAGNPQIAYITALIPYNNPDTGVRELVPITTKNALSMTHSGAGSYGYFYNATATTVHVGGGVINLDTSVEYEWLAIGGIF